jgi:hypothetical protein
MTIYIEDSQFIAVPDSFDRGLEGLHCWRRGQQWTPVITAQDVMK